MRLAGMNGGQITLPRDEIQWAVCNHDHPLSGWFAQPYKGMVQAEP